MEDGDGCLDPVGLVDNYDGPKSTDKITQGLHPFGDTDSRTPVEFTQDEDDHFQPSKCYNNITKSLCLKESHILKGKLNGEVGSDVDTIKCDSVIIPDDSKSKSRGDRTSSCSNEVVKVCDERDSLEVPVIDRKRKVENLEPIGLQGDSLASEDKQDTSSKKRMLSHPSIPSQSIVFQEEAQLSKPITDDDSITPQKSSPCLSESPSSDLLQQSSAVPDLVEPDSHLTGFAQYLGLQPIVKFRCFKCEETGFPTLSKLQEHQNVCLTNLKTPLLPKPIQPHISVHPSPSSTNFRISRKVFLCGSCGTYYENWNLFLHMRDVHKRLICLYCLAMFPQSDMLASHLAAKHGLVESVYSSPEHLFRECKGPCFLMCCACDAIFTESDDFSSHACTEKLATRCQFCGLRGTHFPECPRVTTGSNTISTSPTCSFSQTDAVSTMCESNHSPRIPPRECGGASITKYLIPVSSVQVPYKKTASKKTCVLEDNQEIANELSDVDDDYDISNAASFCHVNIHEPLEKLTAVTTSNLKTSMKVKPIDVLSCIGTQSIVSDVVKSLSTSKKFASDSSASPSVTMDSGLRHDESQLGVSDSRKDSGEKSTVHEITQDVDDSLLINKVIEQKSEQSSHLVNNTSIENNTNNSSEILQMTDKNIISQQISKTELNDTCEMPCVSTEKEELDPGCSLIPKIDLNYPCTSPPKLECSNNVTSLKSDVNVTSTSSLQAAWETITSESITLDVVQSASSSSLATGTPKLSSVAILNDSSEPLIGADMTDDELPAKTDVIDSSSPAQADMIDSKLPARTDVIDSSSPLRKDLSHSIIPERIDVIDSKSPSRTDIIESNSPARKDVIDSNSPQQTDLIDSKSRRDSIDSKSRRDSIDAKSPARTDVIDISRSPARTDVIDRSRSPPRTDLIDTSRSPRTGLNDSSQSPHREEWNESSKSPLRLELNISSESPPSVELNKFSKLLPDTELNDSSKSPSSRDLNYSPCTSPLKDMTISPRSPTELYLSKSPMKTALLNDSSRASSNDNTLKSSSPAECRNHASQQSVENLTDTSYSHPLSVAELLDDSKSPSHEELSTQRKDSSSDTPVSPTLTDEYNSGSCTEKLLTGTEINPNIPFVTSPISGIRRNRSNSSSNRKKINIRISKAILNVIVPSRRKVKGRSKASSRSRSKLQVANVSELPEEKDYEPNIPSITDLEKNKIDEASSASAKVKRKKKAGRGAKRYRPNRKSPRSNKADADIINGKEKIEDLGLPLKTEEMCENIQVAGDEVPVVELHLEDDLEVLTIQVVLQESVKTACLTCVYCNHAKKIAVNGKQLALHLLAEHKFLPVYIKCENSSAMNYLSPDELSSKKVHASGEVSTQVPTTEETDKVSGENKVLMDKYINKLKMSLASLQDLFLNTDTYDSSDRTFSHPYDRTYECFHCNFLTVLHKELYIHNRKMHQKTILLCIMCKSNFYSYSELLCHLCPGIYVPESNIKFRCHICLVDSLPSTFRLMVHLRKRHFVCDVCLETTDDQQKLSTHVWKHKLHHLCYRCGIAYRNKPDITKHLFWKHGTESVLCKKCLQKKWPHVYHFCIPPNAFVCEECNASFSRAVALKVHKRLHTGDLLHGCDECEERFISKKLLNKHQDKHREIFEPKVVEPSIVPEESKLNLVEEEQIEHKAATEDLVTNQDYSKNQIESQKSGCVEIPRDEAVPGVTARVSPTELTMSDPNKHEEKTEKKKLEVVDVYDLPPLNLSSDSDDSEGDQDLTTHTTTNTHESLDITIPSSTKSETVAQVEEDNQQPVQVVDGIWDNFQNYKANLERRESQSNENVISTNPPCSPSLETGPDVLTIMLDHDYCVTGEVKDGTLPEGVDQVPGTSIGSLLSSEQRLVSTKEVDEKIDNDKNNSFDHDYCFNKDGTGIVKEEETKVKDETATTYVSAASTNADASNKKTKSQKKKKHSASSSSSDSSSSSGSSSCSCGENCSCSSSSSSSGSSSDSSESDKSNSEGRRRQIARKERRERVKKKKEEEASAHVPHTTNGTPDPEEQNQTCGPPEPEDTELPILESDLDTDETETDEDFYDQHPQLLANKLMAEKRNQLLLLAPVNSIATQLESAPPTISELSPPKKKVKSKKRKKRQHDAEKNLENKLKLNISTNYYNFQVSNPDVQKPVVQSHILSPVHPLSQSMLSRLPPAPSIQNAVERASMSSAAESGSETDSKRLSKRRRMPKKFYGDSSDEDSSSHTKWSRKPQVPVTSSPLPCPPLTPPSVYKNINPPPEPARIQPIVLAISEPERSEEEDGAETESEQGDVKKSSSDSSSESDGEKDMEIHTDSDAEPPLVVETMPVQQPIAQKNENLYCYCQCPYDEVSEMIACDGKDCTIEWFHFECVGIMVPPKGKWYCPDCRKNVPTKNQYFS